MFWVFFTLFVITIFYIYTCYNKTEVFFLNETPVVIKDTVEDRFLNFNGRNFLLGNKKQVFKLIPNNTNKINKNEFLLKIGNKFMNIIYPSYATNTLYISLTKNYNNTYIMKIYTTKYGNCIKFYNEYYACIDPETLELLGSREHDNIFYFTIQNV